MSALRAVVSTLLSCSLDRIRLRSYKILLKKTSVYFYKTLHKIFYDCLKVQKNLLILGALFKNKAKRGRLALEFRTKQSPVAGLL